MKYTAKGNIPLTCCSKQFETGGLKMQDRKRKDQKRTIVGKCRTGKWRTIFGVKSEGGKCRTGKWRNKFGVKPECGKCGTGKCRTTAVE